MRQSGPEAQATAGRKGAVTVPDGGAGNHTDGGDQMTPSHDRETPAPEVSAESAWFTPPPTATQSTSDRHERPVTPPAGAKTVAGEDQPGVGTTGAGTVVGTADGTVVVVVDVVGATVVVVVVLRWWRIGAAWPDPQDASRVAVMTTTDVASSLRLTGWPVLIGELLTRCGR